MSLTIIRDTREQFEPTWSDDVAAEQVMKLEYGDFSAASVTDRVALELKWSLDDLAACVGRERGRFDTMLRGLQRYPMRALIVAATTEDVREHRYTSAVRPNAIIASTWAWAADYSIPCIWARDASGATRVIEWWLRRAVEKQERGEYAIERADRRDVITEVAKTVREEMRTEFMLSGLTKIPQVWFIDDDKVMYAERLRAMADELDPPQHGEGV